MINSIITIENLSKRYLIGHQTAHRERYTTLRDVVTREVRNFTRKAADLVHGRQVIQGDEVEEFWALRGVSFEVKQGEVIGLIGRNGAGKSTLLKILSRITEPTEGRVTLRGRVASLLEVGTGFHPELTGRENIFLNGAILGMTQREISRQFDAIVNFADVEQFLDTPVKRYSSGMYVRLAFAIAAHLESEILVIDEVLAVGDAEFQKKCLGKMTEVARGGRTILFVSHNHAAIRTLCTHAVVMRAGCASLKQDVLPALEHYSTETQMALDSSWSRPENLAKPPIRFETIQASIVGSQPNLLLLCRLSVTSERDSRQSFIAVDILNQGLAVIMQALPKFEPFVGGTAGSHSMELTVELPPLVPGIYYLDFWIGPHSTDTYDYIRQAVMVQVVDTPSPGRTYPFSPNHGSVVPKSTVVVQTGAKSRRLQQNDLK
jgi:ABC-type polysaccharide/polyol phosphate transport system, ATPase component